MKQRKTIFKILSHCLLVLLMPASAYALHLGDINLISASDQPFEAEIQLLDVSADEQNSLSVGLADVAGFRWAGIEWSPVLNQLQFELKRGADGTDYIRIHSNEVVRAPLLHFLLKVAWSKGRLFREYTLELDTPLYLPDEQPGDAVAQSFTAPAGARDWDRVRATVGETRKYGPVVQFDTLWSLARELRPDTSVSIQQMTLALLRTNPDAFSYGNINWLKKGEVLWMPNDFELQAISTSEAFAKVLTQNNFWREARGYSSVDTGLRTASATVGVDGGLRLVAVAEEDQEDNGAMAVDPDGSARAADLVLANEQVEELSQEKIELEDKLTEAETIIEDLRRLVELKDDELAALQGQTMGKQAEPGPGLLERLNSFYDSMIESLSGPKFKATFDSTYNLARDYWYIALGLLVALVLAGLMLRRRKPDDDGGEEVTPAVAGRPDLAEALAIEKAVFPDEDNGKDADSAAEESELVDETVAGESDISDEIETGEEDSPDDVEDGELEEDLVQNKLELARAYLELGDEENVRSILQEVMSEGNAAQKEEARQLLEQAASE